jgi:hypothetical protein
MIQLIGEDARAVPDWFRARLKDIDRALVVYFNPFQQQFCIDRCVKGSDCLLERHVPCEKTNVIMFPHMGEAALEKLKSMDAWTKTGASGGNDEAALLRFRREHEIAKEEFDNKVREEARDGYRQGMLEDKPQILKALHLIQQHDVARPHK